jgi:rfaE bifunctional protein kinase chain/domain
MFLENLEQLLAGARGLKVAVVGDLMLDRYIWGRVQRISPEAPVPVVNVDRTSHCLGGSANVVGNLQSLGAEAIPVGVTGDDLDGHTLRTLFVEAGVSPAGILSDPGRPTTVKTRVIAHEQHVVRVDSESTAPLDAALADALLARVESLEGLDALVFQDYDKGVLGPEVITRLREHCRRKGILTAVDPKFRHFHAYGPVDLFKPNEKELCEAMGSAPAGDDELDALADAFRRESGVDELVVTRGGKGMVSFRADQVVRTPALSRSIVDVSGAGDTVIAALVLARLQGVDARTACSFASLCAAVACSEVGAVPVGPQALRSLNGRL